MSGYHFRCPRCGTTCDDSWRSEVEHFSEHHFQTAHARSEPRPSLTSRPETVRHLRRRARHLRAAVA